MREVHALNTFASLENNPKQFKALTGLIRDVEIKTPAGIYLGNAKVFDLDNPIVDRFMIRLCRALLSYSTKRKVRHVKCSVNWARPNDRFLSAFGDADCGNEFGDQFAFGG